jgi:hypothetical protein
MVARETNYVVGFLVNFDGRARPAEMDQAPAFCEYSFQEGTTAALGSILVEGTSSVESPWVSNFASWHYILLMRVMCSCLAFSVSLVAGRNIFLWYKAKRTLRPKTVFGVIIIEFIVNLLRGFWFAYCPAFGCAVMPPYVIARPMLSTHLPIGFTTSVLMAIFFGDSVCAVFRVFKYSLFLQAILNDIYTMRCLTRMILVCVQCLLSMSFVSTYPHNQHTHNCTPQQKKFLFKSPWMRTLFSTSMW